MRLIAVTLENGTLNFSGGKKKKMNKCTPILGNRMAGIYPRSLFITKFLVCAHYSACNG